MIPETALVSKLDTETIYSYLNQYQDKFIHDIYKSLDGIPTPSKISAYVETVIQGLLTSKECSIDIKDNKYSVELPDDFGLYLNSETEVLNTYSFKQLQIINKYFSSFDNIDEVCSGLNDLIKSKINIEEEGDKSLILKIPTTNEKSSGDIIFKICNFFSITDNFIE